jgi:hypothetical protein
VLTYRQTMALILASRAGIIAILAAMLCLDPYTGWPSILCGFVAGISASRLCLEFPEFWSSL